VNIAEERWTSFVWSSVSFPVGLKAQFFLPRLQLLDPSRIKLTNEQLIRAHGIPPQASDC
jgi:hypothetical protein